MLAGLFAFSLFRVEPVVAQNQVVIHFFYDEHCSHCIEEDQFLDELEASDPYVSVIRYDVLGSRENRELFQEVKSVFSRKSALTPFVVIGGVALAGYSEQTKSDIQEFVTRYKDEVYVDIVDKIVNGEEILDSDIEFLHFSPGDYVTIPLIGTVNIDTLSLFVAGVVIGLVDGFNPCAMWILLFLIGMLLNLKSKMRRWIYGFSFLLASAFAYFLIMVMWLNIGLCMTAVVWVRLLISLFAVGFGSYSISRFIVASRKKTIGCEIANEAKRSKIRDRLIKIVHERSLVVGLVGIIALAVSVNLLELACSAGLPLLYTEILVYNQLPTIMYYVYILVYIFFFLLDDILIFAFAMITLQITGISNKYQKLSHLIGGLIMIMIGILLLFFPEYIMLR